MDFGAYLHEFAEKLRKSMLAGTEIDLHCDAEHCTVDLDRAVPLGLIVNELVTNAIKYAFPNDGNGTITIALTCHPKEFVVRIADNGRGMPAPDEATKGRGLGMKLVEGLRQQIGATIEAIDGPGTAFKITVPSRANAS
jgi:two-component sensor histidine kinase